MTTRRNFVVGSVASLATIPCLSAATPEAIRPTCHLMLRYLASVTKKSGQIPDYAVMGPGTWAMLAEDFMPQRLASSEDRLSVTQEGYLAIEIAGIPFCAVAECEEGCVIMVHPDNPKACGKFSGLDYIKI